MNCKKLIAGPMRRLAWLTLLASARGAPDVDTLLARAAALARWANRTGPAPPSWTVTSPRDVTVGHEVHAGKIKKVYRGSTKGDLGGSSVARAPARPGPAVRPRRAGFVSRARVRSFPKKHTSTTSPTGRGCSLTSRIA